MELKVSVQFLLMRYSFHKKCFGHRVDHGGNNFVLVLNKSNRIVGSKGLCFALSQIHHENELIKHFRQMCRFLDCIK